MNNPFSTIEARIENIIEETSAIKTFVIKPKEKVSFATGQFMELSLPGVGEAPFTPSSSPYKTETIDVTIMNAGLVTGKLHNSRIGDTVGLRGPYGKGYPVESFYDKEVLIIGGGVGLAPLRSLLYTLFEQAHRFKGIILCYGAKTPQDVVYKNLFHDWKKIKELRIHRSVDTCPEGQKWNETTGVVTTLLDKVQTGISSCIAIVCGPPVMMKFTTLKLLEQGYRGPNIYLSMERNMSCGLGKCGHCAVGPYFVCKDGPVFTYEQLKTEPEIWA
jgi:NAD(P)H-flavin reductase